MLYNKEADIYYPKENILKVSDGKWYKPQSFRLEVPITYDYITADSDQITVDSTLFTVDRDFVTVANNSIYNFDLSLLVGRYGVGSISNATCVIESASFAIDQTLGIEVIELFVSNIDKPFNSIENLNIVYGIGDFTADSLEITIDSVNYTTDENSNTAPLSFSGKIIGSLSSINIDPKNRGLKYKGIQLDGFGNIIYEGDPVVISGGLANNQQAQGAVAYVGNVQTGSISHVGVIKPGYNYLVQPNTVVTVINAPGDVTGAGANVVVQSIDTTNATYKLIGIDAIEYKQHANIGDFNYFFANATNNGFPANSATLIGQALTFANLQFAPLQSMNVINQGGGYTAPPSINLQASYYTDFTTDLATINDFTDVAKYRQYIDDLGFIAAVQVINGGSGYSNATDMIVCESCIGYNAAFSFTTSGNGAITSVTVTNQGQGYFQMPTIGIVNAANNFNVAAGHGAQLVAYGFGQGATLNIAVNQIGAIEDIRLVDRRLRLHLDSECFVACAGFDHQCIAECRYCCSR